MSNQPFIMEHPLIKHKMSILRDKTTGSKQFRELISELAMLMCYEATRDIPIKNIKVETPVGTADCSVLSGRKSAIISILRAGEGMITGMLNLIPAAKVGHIGLYRDPNTLKPMEYYCKIPSDISERIVFLVDPMLATGGTAVDSIMRLKEHGAKNIRFMCIVAAPEGLHVLQSAHPDVKIYCAALDQGLNSHGYIIPGLGDAGDRIFGTK